MARDAPAGQKAGLIAGTFILGQDERETNFLSPQDRKDPWYCHRQGRLNNSSSRLGLGSLRRLRDHPRERRSTGRTRHTIPEPKACTYYPFWLCVCITMGLVMSL